MAKKRKAATGVAALKIAFNAFATVGEQQWTILEKFALRFWPDLRPLSEGLKPHAETGDQRPVAKGYPHRQELREEILRRWQTSETLRDWRRPEYRGETNSNKACLPTTDADWLDMALAIGVDLPDEVTTDWLVNKLLPRAAWKFHEPDATTLVSAVRQGFDGQAEILPGIVEDADTTALVAAVDELLAFAEKWRGRKLDHAAENVLAKLDHRVAALAGSVGLAVPQPDAVPIDVRIRDPLSSTPRARRYGFTAMPMVGRDIAIAPEWEWRMRALRGFATAPAGGKKRRRTYPAFVREKWLEWVGQHGEDREKFRSYFNSSFANRGEWKGCPTLTPKLLSDALRGLK